MRKKYHIYISICIIIFAVLFLPMDSLGKEDEGQHEWSEWITDKNPTCVSKGRKYRVCNKFPDSPHYEEVALPKTGEHTYIKQTIPKTCTESEVLVYMCKYCNHSYKETTAPPSGHDYGSWHTVTKATEKKEGLKERTCSHNASHTQTRVIPKLVKKEKEVEQKVTSKPLEVASEPQSTEVIIPNNEAVPKGVATNTLDVILSSACIGSIGLFSLLLIPDLYVIKWSRKLRSQVGIHYARRRHEHK